MLNPHGWKDYRYRMLYTDRFHFIHANVTSTTTACPRRRRSGRKAPAAPRSLGLGHRTRGCGCAPPKHGQGKVRGMWVGNASCTHAKTKQKNQPQINDENGLCSILRKLPVSPCLQFGLLLLSNRARGPVPEWRRQLDGGGRSEPLLVSPSLAHCSVSHQLLWPSSHRRTPVAVTSVFPGAGGWESAMGRGSVAIGRSCWSSCRKGPAPGSWLGLLPGEGSCWLWGPA